MRGHTKKLEVLAMQGADTKLGKCICLDPVMILEPSCAVDDYPRPAQQARKCDRS